MTALRRIDVSFTSDDIALLEEMQRRTSFSRSKLVRLAIKAEYGDARMGLDARHEVARAVAAEPPSR